MHILYYGTEGVDGCLITLLLDLSSEGDGFIDLNYQLQKLLHMDH